MLIFVDQSGIRVRPFLIAGIYETNLSQYDKIICFTDLHNIIKLNNWESDQVTGIEIALKEFNQLDDVQANLANKINKTVDSYGGTYATASIKEITPQIFFMVRPIRSQHLDYSYLDDSRSKYNHDIRTFNYYS